VRVDSLQASNFRNLREIGFSPSQGANIVYGDNAHGKTNLLEAIWLFTGARSFRGSKDAEMVLAGENVTSLQIGFYAHQRAQTASIHFNEGKKRTLLNEIVMERTGDLAGAFCAVVFSPDHLSLVKQGPETRRKLLDVSLCQAYPKYMKVLEGYNKALRQRGFLLRDIFVHPELLDTLEVWDKVLCDYGSYVSWMRARYSLKLGRYAREIYDGISKGRERFQSTFVCSAGKIESGATRQDVRAIFEKKMAENRQRDIRHAVTSAGCHRDDLDITVGGLSARSFGSQGQQRSCILALKLAECGILEERNGEPPVILLDDVMSELDEGRRSYLLNQLTGKQVFITCCDALSFSGLEGGSVFQMKNGQIRPEL